MKILVVEDNVDMAANVGLYLEGNGHTVDFARDGKLGLKLASEQDFDAIVLDRGLPGLDGSEVCRILREEQGVDTPILMLTAKDTLDDKLEGFSLGADDYLVKPAPLQELLARLEALVRRYQRRVSARNLVVGELLYDHKRQLFQRAEVTFELQPVARKILLFLMRHAGELVKRESIEYEIWQDMPPEGDALRVHIHAIRTAMDKPFDKPLLKTVRGVGYLLEAE